MWSVSCVQDSLGVEVTSATAGTLEVVVSFSGPSLTLRLSDVSLHVQLTAQPVSPTSPGTADEPAPGSPTGTPFPTPRSMPYFCALLNGFLLQFILGRIRYVVQEMLLQLHPGYETS